MLPKGTKPDSVETWCLRVAELSSVEKDEGHSCVLVPLVLIPLIFRT